MALNPVSLTEALRPWHLAGISAFLFDEREVKDILAYAPPRAARRVAPEPATAPAPPPRMPERRPAAAPASISPSSDSPARPTPPRAAAAPSPAREAVPDVERWPAAWTALWARTPKAPLVWTYAELGADLSGQGDKARSACLRELIGSLALPRGSSAFWPISLPDSEDSPSPPPNGGMPQESCFLQGIRLMRPHGIIVFGPQALAQSGLEMALATPFSQALRNGVLHLLLPDFATILASSSDCSKTAAYLRASLSTLPALFSR